MILRHKFLFISKCRSIAYNRYYVNLGILNKHWQSIAVQ